MNKVMLLGVALAMAGAVFGEKTTTLTCTANGKWSTGTWSDGLPEDGDTVVLVNGTGAPAVTENDLVDTLALIRTEGNALITLTGRDLSLSGSSTVKYSSINAAVSNTCDFAVNVPVTATASSVWIFGENLTFNQDVFIADDITLSLYRHYAQYAALARTLTFNGRFYGPNATYNNRVVDTNIIYFKKTITVKKLTNTSATVLSHYCAVGNYFGSFAERGMRSYWDVAGAMPTDLVITADVSDAAYRGIHYLTGDQTCDRLSAPTEPSNKGYVGFTIASTDSSVPTLTLRPTADAAAFCTLGDSAANGSFALTVDSEEGHSQTFKGRKHNLVGPIVVKKGAFRTELKAEFPNLEKIRIVDGVFEAAATNETVQFASLMRLDIDAAGTFKVTKTGDYSPNVFAANKALVVDIAEGGMIEVPEGVSLSVNNVFYKGAGQVADTYQEGCGWITGGGSVVVRSSPSSWKAPADGAWSEASNWSTMPVAGAPAFITAIGGDYTVSLGVPTAVPSVTYVGNAGSGTATLKASEDVSLANAALEIRDGGRLQVPDGVTFGYGNLAAGQQIAVEAGGRMDVSGTANLALSTGQKMPVALKGGTLSVSNGTLFVSDAAAYADYAKSPFDMTRGARVEVAGTATLALSNTLFKVGGGTIEVKDSATFDWYANTEGLHFGTTAGDTLTLTIRDDAKLSVRPNSYRAFYIGSITGSRMILNLASSKKYEVPNDFYFILGNVGGYGEINLSSGYLKTGGHCPRIGGNASDGANMHSTAEGVLRVTGTGVFDNASGSQYRVQLNGIVLGRGFDEKPGDPGWVKGTLYVADQGVVTNRGSSYIIAGAGYATGNIYQSGGLIYDANTSYQVILGAWGGDSRWEITNGLSYVKCDTYVGGILTNQLAGNTYAQTKPDWATLGQRCNLASRNATGLLNVIGGRFVSEKEIIVGIDGHGTLAIGPTGFVSAKTLTFTNTFNETTGETYPSRFACTFDANGVGSVSATNLTIAAGSKLLVDLSAYAGKKASFPLISAASVNGAFADGDIELVRNEQTRDAVVLQDEKGVSIRIPRGALLLVR